MENSAKMRRSGDVVGGMTECVAQRFLRFQGDLTLASRPNPWWKGSNVILQNSVRLRSESWIPCPHPLGEKYRGGLQPGDGWKTRRMLSSAEAKQSRHLGRENVLLSE
ncbi:unnamed protein product, partial [Ectocarpus sp. 12 AP-2014]